MLQSDAATLEALAEVVEGAIPSFPESDRALWIAACCRARRIALDLAAGRLVPVDDEGGVTS